MENMQGLKSTIEGGCQELRGCRNEGDERR